MIGMSGCVGSGFCGGCGSFGTGSGSFGGGLGDGVWGSGFCGVCDSGFCGGLCVNPAVRCQVVSTKQRILSSSDGNITPETSALSMAVP